MVSTVLAKHIPVDANIVLAAGRLLAERVAHFATTEAQPTTGSGSALDMHGDARPSWAVLADPSTAEAAAREELPVTGIVTVLGFCETAVGLGAIVADTLGAGYLHSTRYPRAGQHHLVDFVESHSHAPNHVIAHTDPDVLAGTGPLVLVDDELTTGKTALAAIEEIHARWPRPSYIVAALLDWRGPDDLDTFRAFEASTGATVTVVSLHNGDRNDLVTPDPGTVEQPGVDPAAPQATVPAGDAGAAAVTVTVMDGLAPATPFATGSSYPHDIADEIAAVLVGRGISAVVGVEECMFVPVLVAARLGTTAQSTTLSPVVVSADAGYPIRSAVTFPSPCGPANAYAYNVAVGARAAVITDTGDPAANLHMATMIARHTGQPVELVLMADAAVAHTANGGAAVRTSHQPERQGQGASRSVRTFALAGSVRSSFAPDDVEFVVADLGDRRLETSLAEREARMQSGGHYSEMLPIEYVPSQAYQRLFHEILATSAEQVALAVAVTAERIMARHLGNDVVIASLARAGTPIGVLLVRYWRLHGLAVPHYTLSIVRGKGIDELAVAHIRTHHPHAAIQFVDGWTGKGAIATELEAACARPGAAHGLDPTLAVVADPGHASSVYGTRDDLLLPSACLNSTVSGLVSRTVFRPELTGGFHGAKFYGHLADQDVSTMFVDTIEASFPARNDALVAARMLETSDDSGPTWQGRQCVSEIAARFGIADINLIKPGVGETLRVLLRRDPWKILVRSFDDPAVAPILALAAEKQIDVVAYDDMTYVACGLIKPQSTADA